MKLYNDDCFNVFPQIEDKSIDLFVLDLPYANKKFGNCTACKWDTPIDLKEMWKQIKRIMKPNATIVHFCNTKFGWALIESNPKWFRYDLIWKKSRKVGFLSANKMPLRQHENIYIFNGMNEDNDELMNYSKKILKYINKSKAEIKRNIKDADHFFRYSKDNFSICNEETYNKLIELYNIDKMEGFKTYEEIIEEKPTYNSQKTEGKPYKNGAIPNDNNVYGTKREKGTIIKTDRHPTSIIDIEPNHENIYVFKDKQGTYNPQKTEGKRYIDNRDKPEKKGYYRAEDKVYTRLKQDNNGLYHPTSIIDIEPNHENIYVFKDKQGTYNPQKTEGHKSRDRSENKKDVVNSVYGKVDTEKGNNTTDKRHPTSIIDIEPDHENIYVFKDKQGTYNPQKTEGKPYKINEGKILDNNAYGSFKRMGNNKGDRHPTSIIENTILEYKNPHKTIHRTQKPVDLLEWLIKTYSNENDTVMDFCMGSGTAGVACKNLNRKFIGVEKDKEMFEKAKDRIEK